MNFAQLQPNTSNLKACLFNLIIYTHEPRRTAYFHDIARMIAKQFPCRIIFIQGEASAKEPYLRVELKTEKDEIGSGCDFIFIEAGGSYLERVRFIILPYFVPDLPIYLLWGQDPTTENIILPHLLKFATRLVFDPESSDNLQRFSQNMLVRLDSSSIAITDMNWVRIRGWREVLSQTFDSQERIDQLNHSKFIKIVYNNRPSDLFFHPQTQAFYLQAWLAAQLKWEFQKLEKNQHTITLYYLSSANSPIEVRLEGESKQSIQTEEVLEFEASDQSNFLYSLSRKKDHQVVVHCNTLDRCELPFTLFLPDIWSGRSFMQEIFYKRMSEQYFNMLHLISKIPGGQN